MPEPSVTTDAPPPAGPPLDDAARRWLHDKYEHLAEAEGTLASTRTSYFAAIGTVLVTGLVIVLNYFLNEHTLLLLVTTFFAGLGIMISFVWLVLLRRTVDAQDLWRAMARYIEQAEPPLPGELIAPVVLRSGETLRLNLFRPYTAHAARFARDKGISWWDRLTPDLLTQVLPGSFLVIWVSVLIVVWVYVLA